MERTVVIRSNFDVGSGIRVIGRHSEVFKDAIGEVDAIAFDDANYRFVYHISFQEEGIPSAWVEDADLVLEDPAF